MFVNSSNCRLNYKEERFYDPSLMPEIDSFPLGDQIKVDEMTQSDVRDALGLTPDPDAYVPHPLYDKRRELVPVHFVTPEFAKTFDDSIHRILARINMSTLIRKYGKTVNVVSVKLQKLYTSYPTTYHVITDVALHRQDKKYGTHIRLWFEIDKANSIYVDGCLLMGRIPNDRIMMPFHEAMTGSMHERIVPGRHVSNSLSSRATGIMSVSSSG